jgi:hypothetical protein
MEPELSTKQSIDLIAQAKSWVSMLKRAFEWIARFAFKRTLDNSGQWSY